MTAKNRMELLLAKQGVVIGGNNTATELRLAELAFKIADAERELNDLAKFWTRWAAKVDERLASAFDSSEAVTHLEQPSGQYVVGTMAMVERISQLTAQLHALSRRQRLERAGADQNDEVACEPCSSLHGRPIRSRVDWIKPGEPAQLHCGHTKNW
jgi:hypothetical protein